ncbi:rhamnan synthesis F family protein [Rubritalea tangerina]|uniref:Rhamnan synthesis F family protein n=1 Tax=Rubritalea tangerina TaxID=430798 RepID=A0ABW4ZC16_9BACT
MMRLLKRVKMWLHDVFCVGCKKKIAASYPAFDSCFYRSQLPKYSLGHIVPVTHYQMFGRYRGYLATNIIDIKYCASKYGVPECDVVNEYIFRGRFEGWDTMSPNVLSLDENTQEYLNSPRKGESQYAVALHLYHYDLWEEFEKNILEVDDLVDLYVNLIDHGGEEADLIAKKIRSSFPNAVILKFPNHGRDILPFMQLVRSGALSSYKAIIKLHTKKSRGAERWRERLVNSIMYDREHVLSLFQIMENEDVGLIGSEKDIHGGYNLWKYNIEGVKKMVAQLGLSYAGLDSYPDFLAGSIFIIKGSVLDASKNLEFESCDWPPEAGQQDGTVGHQVERLFSILCYEKGLAVRGVSPPSDQ